MEKKELIKLYLQNVDKMFGYANMNAYIDERLKKYTKYCQSKKPEEQIIIWLKLLHENFGKKIVYLGSYLALQEKDMSYLNNAFNSAVTWGQLTITNSGCDHSIHAWNILPHIFCANRFRDIEKIFPKENGLSKNGLKSACSITNLVMYLYYQEPMWKQYVIDESKEFLQNKHTAEEKAVINGFLALIEKNGKNSHWNWLISVKHIENQKIMEKIHLQEKFPFLHYGKYGYESKYVLGDINVMCSMQEHLGVLLELKGRGCRQMESYLLAQERSWYDFMLDCLTAGGKMKRLDLAINDKAGILDIPKLKEKYKAGECISYFRMQKDYSGTEKCGSDLPKNTGETLYLGSTSSELYMCAYQKNYEQYVKNSIEVEDLRRPVPARLLEYWEWFVPPGIYRAAHTAHGFLFHSYFHSISPGLVVSNLYVLVSLGWGLLNGIRLLPILIIPSPGWASSRYFRCGSDRPYNSTTLSMSLV